MHGRRAGAVVAVHETFRFEELAAGENFVQQGYFRTRPPPTCERIKNLKLKGCGVVKQGTKVKNIRLVARSTASAPWA